MIAEVDGWRVEHCVGPLGLGTLLVKPTRHVLSVAGLSEGEAAALGPLLQRTASVVSDLCEPDQVYVCLWSHAGGQPGHIHFVVQPVTQQAITEHGGVYGPELQMAMFNRQKYPSEQAVVQFADSARRLLAS